MISIFFYSEGVIIINYLEKEKSINGQYFASELSQPKEAVAEAASGCFKLLPQLPTQLHLISSVS